MQRFEFGFRESLGETAGYHLFGRGIHQFDFTRSHLLPYELTLDINVFGAPVVSGVCGEGNCPLIVAIDHRCESVNRLRSARPLGIRECDISNVLVLCNIALKEGSREGILEGGLQLGEQSFEPNSLLSRLSLG